MLALVIAFAAAALILAILLGLQNAQNKHIAHKLRRLNAEERTQLITMSFPSRSAEALVTEINRLVQAKEEQAQAYRAKGQRLQQTISNISHDMRTPLTVVLGYIRLINQSDLTDGERRDYMRVVEARARTLYRLVQDFYDLSRLDEGEYQFDFEWVDVNQTCLEFLAVEYDDFTNRGFAVDVDMPSSAPKVLADRNAVSKVFENLFGNVKKHGRDRVAVSGRLEAGSYVIEIKNAGAFMARRDLERVFDRSYTVDSSRTNENTGLGLHICKTLLGKMKHDIRAAYDDGFFIIQLIWSLENR